MSNQLPPPLPTSKPVQSAWAQLPLPAKILVAFSAGFVLLAIIGTLLPDPPTSPASPQNEATTPVDPCSWARRPSGMTREACERIGAVQYQLQSEQERERNPNYKPYSIAPNR